MMNRVQTLLVDTFKCECKNPKLRVESKRGEIEVTEDNPLATHKEFKPGPIIKGKITCTRCMQIITFTKHEAAPIPERLV